MVQILRVLFSAYLTRSSEVSNPSASVNQGRDGRGVEKSTFSSVRHSSNCLTRFFLMFLNFHETSSQYYFNLLLSYAHSSSSQVEVKQVKGKNGVLGMFVSATEMSIMSC